MSTTGDKILDTELSKVSIVHGFYSSMLGQESRHCWLPKHFVWSNINLKVLKTRWLIIDTRKNFGTYICQQLPQKTTLKNLLKLKEVIQKELWKTGSFIFLLFFLFLTDWREKFIYKRVGKGSVW